MSFPKIPDINPDISITKEDAVALLLASIALEEVSLSDLIDAETEKVRFAVKECKSSESSIQDLIEINRSVDKTVKDIIKLQMLLQFKLENVIEIICPCPTTTTTSTTSSTTSTTTSTSTTTRTSSKSSTTTKTSTSKTTTTLTTSKCITSSSSTCAGKCKCSLVGRGQGGVSNCKDQFFGGISILQACVCRNCKDINDSSLCYSVHKGAVLQTFTAYPGSLIIKCPTDQHPDKLVIKGYGYITKKDDFWNDISVRGSFLLTVWDDIWSGVKSFHMIITADKCSELNHDSGVVSVKCIGLTIGGCPDPLVSKHKGKGNCFKR